MNIQIGKTYRVSPSNKKCFVENVWYVDAKASEGSPRDNFIHETVWRLGSMLVSVNNDEDKELLEYMLNTHPDEEISFDEFTEAVFDSSWDEWTSEVYFSLREDSALIDEIGDADDIEEEIRDMGVSAWAEEFEYMAEETSYVGLGPFDIEEI